MKHLLGPVLACLSLVPLTLQEKAPRFLEGAERERFLDELEARMAARKTVAAEFEQEKMLSLFDDKLESRGAILFQAPDKLRWEIQAPFQSILVVAGEDVAKFEFVRGEKRALQLGRGKDPLLLVMSQIRGWFLGKFDRSEKTYRLRVAREPAPLIVLEPAEEGLRKNLSAIEVTLADTLDAVSRVVVREKGGDKTTMVFHEKKRDVLIPGPYFDLKDPRPLVLEALLASPENAPR
jgi:outer membrane lipoprotein-sorting protein